MDSFEQGTYDKVLLIYNRFKNAATQLVTVEQFLPIVAIESASKNKADYIYEPSQDAILRVIT